ncbi:MAG: hypothetical protein NWE98_00610 [Candidatus Bathyarchaeota archaeon]|nr:hypothetical protein [Candidatus Bathyarchaeota archaeon]
MKDSVDSLIWQAKILNYTYEKQVKADRTPKSLRTFTNPQFGYMKTQVLNQLNFVKKAF